MKLYQMSEIVFPIGKLIYAEASYGTVHLHLDGLPEGQYAIARFPTSVDAAEALKKLYSDINNEVLSDS